MISLKTSAVREALYRAFEEGLCGFSEVKDELIDSILSELISSADRPSEAKITEQSAFYTYLAESAPMSYSISTSTIPSFSTVNNEEPL